MAVSTAAALVQVLAAGRPAEARGSSLRFHGAGVDDLDRVKIRVDDPATSLPGPPTDVGATDFTIEFRITPFAVCVVENDPSPCP